MWFRRQAWKTCLPAAIVAVAALVMWACHVDANEEAFLDIKADATWTAFDSIKVVLVKEDGTPLDTLFKGELKSLDQLKKLRAKGFDGGKVQIVILGFDQGQLVKTEIRHYDGRTQANTGPNTVVLTPIDPGEPVLPDPKDSSILDIRPDVLKLYRGGPKGLLAAAGTSWAGKALTWTTSHSSLATVSGGEVTPLGAGKVRIFAEAANKSKDSSEITIVTDAPVIDAGPDTAVPLNTNMGFRIEVTQEFGVVAAFKWSLDGDSAWDDSASGLPAEKTEFAIMDKKFTVAGTFVLRFYARDGEGNESVANRTITVTNQIPRITSLAKDADITEGDSVAFTGKAEVNAGALKKFTWNYGDGTPEATGPLTGLSAVIPGGHRFAKEGTFKVTLTIEDDVGTPVSASVTVKAAAKTVPKPPVANAGSDTSILLGTGVNLHGSATDPDGSVAKLEWSIGGDPFVKSAKGDTTFTPVAVGSLRCLLRATDNDGLTDLDTVDITVAKSQPPVVFAFLPADISISIKDSLSFSAKVTSQVPLKTSSWDFNGDGIADETGILTGTTASPATGRRFPTAGIFNVTLKVTDDLNGTATGQTKVTVLLDAPKAVAGKDTSVAAGTLVNLRGIATDGLGEVVKMEWKIGPSVYKVVSSPDTGFTAPALGAVSIRAFFRVTDDDGLTGEDTVDVSVAAAVNANLSALAVSAGALSPVFAAATTAYTVAVANGVATTTVTASVAGAGASLKVNGTALVSGGTSAAIDLLVGTTVITVEAKAQNGVVKPYTVSIKRAGLPPALSGLTVSTGTLSPVFAAATAAYTLAVPFSASTLKVTPTANYPFTITANGTVVASGAAFNLAVGANPITIVVTSTFDATTKTYTLTATRAAPATDPSLSALTLSRGTISFVPATLSYRVSVNADTASLLITPTTNDPNATVTVKGKSPSTRVALAFGSDSIAVVVTAQDGITKRTYILTVTRRSYEATCALVAEDCIRVNPANVTVSTTATTCQLMDGDLIIETFPATAEGQEEANLNMSIIQFYGLNQKCLIGRGTDRPMQYWKVNGEMPIGAFTGGTEDCLGVAVGGVTTSATFQIISGGGIMEQMSTDADAKQGACILNTARVSEECFVGRPQASLLYYRR